jgi:hypothetical protein
MIDDDNVVIHKNHGIYNQFIIFETTTNGEATIWSYNILKNDFEYILKVNLEFYELIIKDNHILIFEENSKYKIYILN